jgi:hypothetical protein
MAMSGALASEITDSKRGNQWNQSSPIMTLWPGATVRYCRCGMT